MPSFANSALRLLRRLLGAPTRIAGPYAGEPTVLDGNTAVAVTEAAIGELAALGASFPADAADVAWRTEQLRQGRNSLGNALGNQSAEGPRGALAGALGLTLGGIRATAFLAAPDLTVAQDLLRLAAGRRLPLVIHLANRALPGHAIALGSGHEACHLAADSGAFVLFAANVQEVVDLTLIARRVAEETLTPGLVVMDGDRTALAMQEVRLPPAELVARFLGAPGDAIPAPTAAQRLLFGDHRRRVPRWHDPDHPVLLGALQSPEVWGLGAAAADLYFDGQVHSSLEQAISDFRHETGRSCEPISAFQAEDARILLLAQGSAVETAQAVAKYLRQTERLRVGVLGLRCLRPFPGPALLAHLGTARHLLVLERVNTPLADDPPLLRELRALFDRGLDAAGSGVGAQPGSSALLPQDRPRLHSVIYGLGGLPLHGTDLIRLCREAGNLEGSRIFLGMDFAPRTSTYPKRQVLLDRLRRDYPNIAGLGLHSREPTPDLRPTGALTLAVHRRSGQWGEGLATEAAGFLRRFAGAHLRGHPALFSQPLGSYCIDRFTLSDQPRRDPGAFTPIDLSVLAVDPGGERIDPLVDLRPDGALLLRGPEQDDILWQTLSATLQQALQGTDIALYAVPPADAPSEDLVLGAICGLLRDQGWIELSPRRLVSAREAQLADADLPQPEQTSDPDQETRMQQFQAGLDGIRRIDYRGLPVSEATPRPEPEAPAAVRRFTNIDDTYDSLPRFWDQVGVLYRDGVASQLAPDPYLAIGAVPPLLSSFHDLSTLRTTLPRLDPDLCTGCGRCWSQCPEGAWGAVAATPSQVLDATIPAVEAGALRPLDGKLAERIDHSCRADEAGTATLGTLINSAYAWLQDQSPLPAARKPGMDTAIERLTTAVGCLPVAVATPFLTEASGALLFLALNPHDCKGCGICVQACDADALQSVPQTSEELERTNRIFMAWERLPETTRDVINVAAANEQIGPLPAALLPHRAARALTGGDGAEAGSGERLTLCLALGLAASHQEHRQAEFIREVKETHQEIMALIRSIFADALPADDLDGLDALARGLETVNTRHESLSTFLGQAEGTIENTVDAARLRRLVELAQGLGTLAWQLETGRQGHGRAGLGLVLAPGEAVSWAGTFPHNIFQVPVTLDATGDGARLAAGLLESQLRQAVEGFILLRRARLELDKPMDAVRLWSDLAGLSWRELTLREKERCPSMLLVGSSRILAGAGLSQVAALLGSDLPLKILVLADLDLGLASRAVLESAPASVPDAATDLGLLALARRDAYIAQTSFGAPTHFLESLTAGLDFDGPALFHVHAPSPGRHGFPTDQTLERARLAVATRTFPLFRYDPGADGVFGTRIDLGANPEPLAPWGPGPAWPADQRPTYPVAKAPGLQKEEIATPAHWALGEARFRHWLEPLVEDAPDPLPINTYLELSERERRGRTPYLSQVSQGQTQRDPVRYRVAPELVEVCRERHDAWRLLQELGGLVTPFTERVRREAEEQVAAAHRAELAAQAAEYEQKLADLRSELQQELRGDIRERLMDLAGYRH